MAKSKTSAGIGKSALILCAITLIAGLLLAAAYQITKEPIAAQEEKLQQEAYRSVLADAARFEGSAELDRLVENSPEVLEASGVALSGAYITGAVTAYDENEAVVGYVINAVTPSGYGGDISISVGFDSEGIVTGVEILSIGETAGLGMKAKNESFREQYVGHAVSYFTVTKTNKQSEEEIDAISSATITSQAMTDAVNAALLFVRESILEGGTE